MSSPDHTTEPIRVPLARGQIALISPEDSDLNNQTWSPLKERSGGYYAIGTVQGRRVLMHRIILGRILGRLLDRTEQCDHIDLNKLNNQRSNLRLATGSQNQQNKPKPASNTTGYKGVSFDKKRGKYYARIRTGIKRIHLGYFDDPVQAYSAYCEAAKQYHGDYARME